MEGETMIRASKKEQQKQIQLRKRNMRNNQINARELWQELNTFRKNPQLFYSLISARKQYYNKQGLLFSVFHPQKGIKTQQGRQPINQLLQNLVNMPRLNPIAYNSDLNTAAQDIARQYQICHSTNTPFELNPRELRMILSQSQKFIFPHPVSCVIGVGFRDEYEPLLSLLIDDGIHNRKNRRIFLSEQFQVCGIGATPMEDPALACGVYLFTKSVINKAFVPL